MSIEYKLFHSHCHARYLFRELRRYFKRNPGALVREEQSSLDAPTFVFRAKGPTPARIPLLLGDCLQNLRSALDYLVWELVLAAKNHPTNRNQFPVCSTAKGFEDALKGHRLDGVDVNAIYKIEGLQPYYFKDVGMEHCCLAVLDELVNINKHRHITLTVLNTAPLADFQIIERDGKTYGYGNFVGSDTARQFVLPSGEEPNTQIAAFMQINEGYLKGAEVTSLVNLMAQVVTTGILPLFEEFFA